MVRVTRYLLGYGMSWGGMMMVVVSMGSSSSSSAGGSSVIAFAIAEIMHVAELGYLAACIDVSWVVRRSRTSLIVV